MIASIIANVNRDTKARPQPYEIKDFLLRFKAPASEPQSWQEQMAITQTWKQVLAVTEGDQ